MSSGRELQQQHRNGELRLLEKVSQRMGESVAVSAYVITDNGDEIDYSGNRLGELTQKLWPPELEYIPEDAMRTLRFLNDQTRRDFLLIRQRDCFVIRTDFARALIEHNRVIFLGEASKNPTFHVFTEELLMELKGARGDYESNDKGEDWRFDLFVLECIVCACVTVHTLRLRVMEPAIDEILKGVDMGASEASILRMYPLKVALHKFIEQVRPLVNVLQSLVQRAQEEEQNQPRSRLHTATSSFIQPDSGTEDPYHSTLRRRGRGNSNVSGPQQEAPEPLVEEDAAKDAKALGGPFLGLGSAPSPTKAGTGATPSSPSLAPVEKSPTSYRPKAHTDVSVPGMPSVCEMSIPKRTSSTWSPYHTNSKRQLEDNAEKPELRDLDDMLELWLRSAEEVMGDASELSQNIEDATRFLQASMSYLRNRLLRLELVAMVATLALGFGALVSGIFGMNLKSGVDQADGWFISVVVMIVVVGLIMIIGSLCYFKRTKQDYKLNCHRFGNNAFFARIDDDQYILSLVGQDLGAQGNGNLHPRVLERISADLAKQHVPGAGEPGARRSISSRRLGDSHGTLSIEVNSANSLRSPRLARAQPPATGRTPLLRPPGDEVNRGVRARSGSPSTSPAAAPPRR